MTSQPPKSLRDKLDLKPGMSTYFLHAPGDYIDQVGYQPRRADEESGYDFIHVFYHDRQDLEAFMPFLISKMADDGMLWVSWPKTTSGVKTDLSDQVLRDIFLPEGLVDIKVCSVSDIWSALKFVWRNSVAK